MKIKKGDTIFVISGREKGKKGKIVQTFIKKNRVTVENINLRKKNVRAKKSGEKGQIVEFPASINASNVMLVCPKCSMATKIGYQIIDNKKKRICKKCKKDI